MHRCGAPRRADDTNDPRSGAHRNREGRIVTRIERSSAGVRSGRSGAGVRIFALTLSLALCASALTVGPALALPEGRVYEMVSPVYKGGYGAKTIEAVAPDGESVAFYSAGAFAEAPSGPEVGFDYIARRGASGWSTTPLIVPSALLPYVASKDVSSTLSTVMAFGKPGADQEGAFQASTEAEVVLHPTNLADVPANWEMAGPAFKLFHEESIILQYIDASPDLCHILLTTPFGSLSAEEPGVTGEQVYEFDRGCGGEPVTVRRLGLNNKGKSISPGCGVRVGGTVTDTFNAVADDGKQVFFSTCPSGMSENFQLFVRLEGSRTLEVSKPLGEACGEVPCPDGPTRARTDFVGASEDGSSVFFTTSAPLEPAGDRDNGNDLYMARIGCPTAEPGCEVKHRVVTSLVQVSHDPNGGEAGVRSVMRVAPDGSRVYFVASGDLLDGAQQKALEGEGRAVPHAGADNLYVYDATSTQMGFVGDLCSGKELSGATTDLHCPSATDGSDEDAQTAGPDGRFLVFATHAQLVAGDTDSAQDVYRYDAVTGALQRVSTGEDGFDANGNNDRFEASIPPGHWGGGLYGAQPVLAQYEMNNRAVSEDGSRIVFESAEPLSPTAVNGLVNVYEWHEAPGSSEGSVSLISSGSDLESDEDAVISPTGRDVFFVTSQGLAAQDTDGSADIYDARLGGGFPQAPAERRPCEGDACQGPLSNPAPLLVPGSAVQMAGGNFPASGAAPGTTPKKAGKPRCSAGRKLSHGRCVKTKRVKLKARRAGKDRGVQR